jgi:hypothetical protein
MATGPVSPEVPNPAITNDLYNRQMTALLNQLAEAQRRGDTAQVEAIKRAIAAVEATYKDPNAVPDSGTKPAPVNDPNRIINPDGTITYTNPQTGEKIVYDAQGNVISTITIPQADDSRAIVVPPRIQQSAIGPGAVDWRFKMMLSSSANYLYRASNPGILAPLAATGGVIFPYTPAISLVYQAGYNSQELTHSNYKIYTYKSSSVEAITINGEFTAQDSIEANYVLAVIHFFKSVTKMFYGQDQNPSRGIPPPLVYLQGYGQYQFDLHPVVVSSFTYTFPTDVDYIDAFPTNPSTSLGGVNLDSVTSKNINSGGYQSQTSRLNALSQNIVPGGNPAPIVFNTSQNINEATRIPTKLSIQLTCLPIVTRNAISNKFSLRDYATGALMKGSVNSGTGGGIW